MLCKSLPVVQAIRINFPETVPYTDLKSAVLKTTWMRIEDNVLLEAVIDNKNWLQ